MEVSNLANDFDALTKLLEHSAKCCQEKKETAPSSKHTKTPRSSKLFALDVEPMQPTAPRSAVQEQWQKRRFQQQDGRTVPQCDILYRQAVESGDVFLGLSGKTPSTVSCEELLIKIYVPEESSMEDLTLECRGNRVVLESSRYKLFQYLPHKVDGERGIAKWHSKQHLLEITVPIVKSDPL